MSSENALSEARELIAEALESRSPDLDLSDLELLEVPAEIGALTSLEELDLSNNQLSLLNAYTCFPDRQERRKRIVRLPINPTGLARLGPFDDVIAFAQSFSTTKVGSTVRVV